MAFRDLKKIYSKCTALCYTSSRQRTNVIGVCCYFWVYRQQVSWDILLINTEGHLYHSLSKVHVKNCVCVCSVTRSCPTLQLHELLCPWNFPDKNTGCPFLLQEIFPTQGPNQHLLHFPCWQVHSLLLVPPDMKNGAI